MVAATFQRGSRSRLLSCRGSQCRLWRCRFIIWRRSSPRIWLFWLILRLGSQRPSKRSPGRWTGPGMSPFWQQAFTVLLRTSRSRRGACTSSCQCGMPSWMQTRCPD
ncbi:hypothetical protein AMAG_19836 [Allomyces macrogynus ATCC 38327]|uniref:Uncharacterized protein n=1 Tax=Allomyces macrogynus (strain ATCC 38327) TaxID=578462 RepID=A0A0L0SZX6_ALLM3|nr:hypothetical protein AMAG_19836 [Allomyces macrogynus ATCC 38327]|eukprot:KNE68046.1 hypothetical protein AMAG_19836 [Allomyces macrogynus ATCC 38327]